MEGGGHLVPALCLAGPTACGKTELAIRISEILDCEIINADSRQLYRDFPIITAQPGKSHLERIPHHLYGILKTSEKMDAAHWARMGAAIAGNILKKGKIPLFVGGTGFYIKTLFEGLSDMPQIDPEISEHIREEMASAGPACLYWKLKSVDPDTADKIHPNDRQRIMRGLEVWSGTGKSLAWWQAQPRKPFCSGAIFFMNINLDTLTPRFGERILSMLKTGAEKEARQAYAECSDLSAPGWKGIGCLEALKISSGEGSFFEAERRWLSETRSYAKRQLTWFRGQQNYISVNDEKDLFSFLAEKTEDIKKSCASYWQ